MDYDRLIDGLLQRHRARYEQEKNTLQRYRDVYEVAFWKGATVQDTEIQIEVPDANSWIEGFVAALFSKAPAVRVGGSIRPGDGKDSVAEAVTNAFLYDRQEVFTNGTRVSLIFPSAFFKVCVDADLAQTDAINAIGLEFLLPWEVIVDESARSLDACRWIGHARQITVAEAKSRWPGVEWAGEEPLDFLQSKAVSPAAFTPALYMSGTKRDAASSLDWSGSDMQFVTLVEFYDLVKNRLILYSPSVRFEDDGGSKILSESPIPLKDWRGRPMCPVIPYYLNASPDAPLRGISALRKIYDQVREKNLLRSKMAEIVRRDVRQLGMDEAACSEQTLEKITTGGEGSIVPFPNGSTAASVWLLPTAPMSNNYGAYLSYIEQDIQRSSPTAPFTRGEATKATATEVNALQQYTSAEIGKMARVRDTAIERVCEVYLATLSMLLEDDQTVGVLTVRGEPVVVKSEDLTGRFKIAAVDQLATPIAQSTRKAELLQLFPALVQLGVPAQEVLRQLGDAFDMAWLKEYAAKIPEQPQPQPQPPPVSDAPVPV